MKSGIFAIALSLGVLGGATAASAASVVATYYEATAGGDFQKVCCSTDITVGAALGPNGLPVYTPAGGDEVLLEVDGGTNEILWWTDDAGGHINQDGPPVLMPLPLSDASMFPSQGGGANNNDGFQTAVFAAFFNTAAVNTAVVFNVTSDDDVFLFIDGQLVDLGLDGIHGPQNTVTPYNVAGAGLHTFKLFYADRHTTQAELHFNVEGATLRGGVVPEPATWAMMIMGFGGVGALLRRRQGFAFV